MNKSSAFHKILVGINGTPEAERAAKIAVSLAKDLQASLVLLGVIAPLSPETQAEGVGLERAMAARTQLKEQLSSTFATARELGIDVVAETAEGDPEKEIERRAEHGLVDLIVVGYRDIARVRRWLEGSTSETLVRTSRTSVLVVHDDNPQR
jgi:nucleotide-binding universal stress UspA family protein